MALFRKALARLAGSGSVEAAAPQRELSPVQTDSERAAQLIARGNQLEDAGQVPAALALYEQAASIAPGLAGAHLNLGIGLAAMGDLTRAVAAYRAGIALEPQHPFLHYNLGRALYLQRDFAGAREHLLRAVEAKPDFAQAQVLLSNALDELGLHEPALHAIERALALDPQLAGAHVNRVRQLLALLRTRAAIAAAQEGLRLHPDDGELHWTLAIAHLLGGDFAAGWREHEWRSQASARKPLPDFGRPRWDGSQDLGGRTLLMFAEQGFGDGIQFLRFLAPVAERAGKIVLRLPGALCALARAAAPRNCVVIDDREPLPDTDYQCPLLSLPLALGILERDLPGAVPYLRADPQRVRDWRRRLNEHGASFTVGLVWSGNPEHANDGNRSIPLSAFAGLADAGCRFVSLQPQVRDSDRDAFQQFGDRLLPYGAQLSDFADSAALVAALDLVISVDTSVAHLAGALGRPVWILLPYLPDWRWMLDRTDSPWYPSARLYRQGEERSWAAVLARVRGDLRVTVAAAQLDAPRSSGEVPLPG